MGGAGKAGNESHLCRLGSAATRVDVTQTGFPPVLRALEPRMHRAVTVTSQQKGARIQMALLTGKAKMIGRAGAGCKIVGAGGDGGRRLAS